MHSPLVSPDRELTPEDSVPVAVDSLDADSLDVAPSVDSIPVATSVDSVPVADSVASPERESPTVARTAMALSQEATAESGENQVVKTKW